MNDIEGSSVPGQGAESASKGGDGASDSLHDVRGIQRYVGQVGQVADALSKDTALTGKLIDAVHSGSSAAVERIFTEIGVDSQVTITMVDGADPDDRTPGDATQSMARAAAQVKTKTITISIGIGPFSISVTVKKESKK